MAGIISREALAAAAARRKTLDVEVEGIGVVRLRALSAGEALDFRTEVTKCEKEGGDPEQLAPSLIARSWVDENNALLMPEAEGVALARSLSPQAYGELANKVLQLNGLSESSIKDAAGN